MTLASYADGISNLVIKILASEITASPALKSLFNSSWSIGIFPIHWKRSSIFLEIDNKGDRIDSEAISDLDYVIFGGSASFISQRIEIEIGWDLSKYGSIRDERLRFVSHDFCGLINLLELD